MSRSLRKLEELYAQIKVIQAFNAGEQIEVISREGKDTWDPSRDPAWDWHRFEYRVTEQPRLELGDKVRIAGQRGEFILAQTGSHDVCLINIVDGHRWTDPVKLAAGPHNIADSEMKQILYSVTTWKLV